MTLTGGIARVATRSDYLVALIDEGEISCEADLAKNPELVIDISRHWLAKPHIGCAFARRLNGDRDLFGLRTVVIAGGKGISQLAAEITVETVAAASNEGVEAVSIILPDLIGLDQLCALLWELDKHEKWALRLATHFVEPISLEPYARVGLDFIQEDSIPSAVLGIGPFEELPMTRRGPFVSLEIRCKSRFAKESDKRPGVPPPVISHLAQIPYPTKEQIAEKSDPMWQQTSKMRLAVLGSNDQRGKGEVTFAIPWEIWESSIPSA